MSITYLQYSTLKLDPKPLDTLSIPFFKSLLFSVKKGSMQGSICLKSVPGPLSKSHEGV
jgi:hypothetical protein